MEALSEQPVKSSQSKHYQVLGIGTPIVDYLIHVSNDYLDTLPGKRGGSILVDHPTLQKILDKKRGSLKVLAGGSAANTIKGLVQLGQSSAFFGKIGHDDTGKKLSESLEHDRVIPLLSTCDLPTAQSACLITPDHDRTMRTYIGAGAEINEADLTDELFKDVELVHIEGYLMNRPGVIEKAMKLAKQAGAKISFDLSSFEIVEEYKKPMIELITHFATIVFANEDEALALTGLEPEKAALILKDICTIAVIKMGSHGCWAATGEKQAFHQAFEVPVIDTTGAGDLFASGFLHGFLTGKTLEENLRYGSFIASQVVQTIGAEIPEDRWLAIKKNL